MGMQFFFGKRNGNEVSMKLRNGNGNCIRFSKRNGNGN